MQIFAKFGRLWEAAGRDEGRIALLGSAAVLVSGIALVDWRIQPNISLGFLYIFPVVITAGHLARWGTVLLAAACAGLREALGPFPWDANAVPRLMMVLTAFAGVGLLVGELRRNRQLAWRRLEAEDSLRALMDTSPAAILTTDTKGNVLLANEAAHSLLGFDDGSLRGEPIARYLPTLARAMKYGHGPGFRTMVEEWGKRRNGEAILTHTWFSTHETKRGRRLAAIVLDVSEDFREKEHGSLQSLMWTSQVLIGALHHEVRNVCEALLGVHAKLSQDTSLASKPDFKALRILADRLRQISSAHLSSRSEIRPKVVSLSSVLEVLRIIIEPSFRDKEAVIRWDIVEALPGVPGDRHILLQVFMNLAQNSLRAMEDTNEKQLTISASNEDTGRTIVSFRDTGPGVAHPERLFTPFQPEAVRTGLGLYVSRVLVRSLGGDLRYEPQTVGALFAVEMISVA